MPVIPIPRSNHISKKIKRRHTENRKRNIFSVKTTRANVPDRITEIGDWFSASFEPQVKIKRWFNDANMSIRVLNINNDPGYGDVRAFGNAIRYIKQSFEARFHYLEGGTPENDCYEFDVVLKTPIGTNEIDFSITTKSLNFYKQEQFSQEMQDQGWVLPENIINSYAVYHKDHKNNAAFAGKAFHIYRVYAEDANGDRVWCDMDIMPEQDGQYGTMKITIPQDWLDNAVYPVLVDPIFGYNTIGGTTYSAGPVNFIASQFTCPDNGTLVSMSSYLASGAGIHHTAQGYYLKNGNLVGDNVDHTASTTFPPGSGGQWWLQSDINQQLTAGTTYWLCLQRDSTTTIYYDVGPANSGRYNIGHTFENWADDPTTATINAIFSIYATYDPLFWGDSNLKKADISDTYAGDSSLLRVISDTFTGDASLIKELSDTFTGDTNLVGEVQDIFTSDTNLKRLDIEATFTADCKILAINTFAFSADANLLRELSDTFDGNAMIIWTYGDTFESDASIVRCVEDTFTGDASIRETHTDTFTGDASLNGVIPDTFTFDTNLVRIVEDSFSGDANLFGTTAPTSFTGDANLEGYIAVTFTGDAILLGLTSGQFNGDSYLYDNDSKYLYGPWAYGGLYGGLIGQRQYVTDAFTGNASIAGSISNTFVSDSNLEKNVSAIFTGDASLSGLVQNTFTGDASLSGAQMATFTGDANLVGEVDTTFTGDSFLTHLRFFGDASLAIIISDTFTGDAMISWRFFGSFTSDANLTGAQVTTFTGDTNLVGLDISSVFTGDASLLEIIPGQFTADASLKGVESNTFTSDANLVGTEETIFTGDTNLVGEVISLFTGDCKLLKVLVTQFAGDASIKGTLENQFTGDTCMHKESVDAFAGLPILESTWQAASFAGDVDLETCPTDSLGLSGMEQFGMNLEI